MDFNPLMVIFEFIKLNTKDTADVYMTKKDKNIMILNGMEVTPNTYDNKITDVSKTETIIRDIKKTGVKIPFKPSKNEFFISSPPFLLS